MPTLELSERDRIVNQRTTAVIMVRRFQMPILIADTLSLDLSVHRPRIYETSPMDKSRRG